jgi:hypothetical protein
MDAFLGFAFFICIGLLVFGLARRFPWFIIQGALVNGPGFLAALYGIFYGVSYATTGSAGWWLLAIVGALFALVCGYNLYHFFSGEEARMFGELVARKTRERLGRRDDDD